jgi:hypothetical protein
VTERIATLAGRGKLQATAEGGLALLAKASGQFEAEANLSTQQKAKPVGKDGADLEFIASIIKSSGRKLVIEDFHYLPIEEQKKFAFDLKTLWDYGTFVVVIGVWISENMLITLNPDLSDRIEELSVTWQVAELKQVLNKGCSKLRLRLTDRVAQNLAEISYESVGLLQKLALRFLEDELNISNEVDGEELVIDDLNAVQNAAMHVAEQLNQLYHAFAKRVCDGISRLLKNSSR